MKCRKLAVRYVVEVLFCWFAIGATQFSLNAQTSNVNVRIMAANLNGNTQSYQPFALRIFQGLKPDIVCIQEFNYSNNTASDFRAMVDTAFGTNFVYYREPYTAGGDIPNGVISRYPFVTNGSWADTEVGNRGFAWAQIDLPGTNSLYVVSVHLLTSSATERGIEAANLKTLIQSSFPSNAWVVVAGDFNTGSRTESPTMTTFDSYLSDNPIPVDNNGNSNTSANRNSPHDYVLPSFSLTNREVATVLPSHSFPSGLVFDSTVYTPLSDVSPVLYGDSTNAQHMAVMKDFSIPVTGSGTNTNTAPAITTQPQSQTNSVGATVNFTVVANGTAPLAYQWRFFGTNITTATNTSYSQTNIQTTNAGDYTVVITNVAGSVTSSVATLTVSTAPVITNQPQNLTVTVGQSATFSVGAGGASPLSYQWRFFGTNLPGATTNSFTRNSAQLADAGNYTVVITNASGSVTSSVATLTVNPVSSGNVIAQWNFNSPVSDATPSTGTRNPSIGSGTNFYIGGTAAASSGEFAAGSSSDTNTTDNSAWNTSSYPAYNSNNKTAGVQFNVSTSGRQNIVIWWASQASNTGSRHGRLQYSTNGTTFFDYPTAITNNAGIFSNKTNSLAAFPNVNDNSSFAFRIVTEFEATAVGAGTNAYVAANSANTYGTGGTVRFDMVTVLGDTISASNPPPAAAVLGAPLFTAGQFQMLVTGTAGTNYVIQASTDLSSTNWTSLATNVSPFTYTNANASNFPARFFRAVWMP